MTTLEARHAAAEARVASDTIERQKFTRNHFKCTLCLRVHHPDDSPLVLCDFCPKSWHVRCLEVELGDLPQGEWACPRCHERHEQNKAKVKELEEKKVKALQRVQQVRPCLPVCVRCVVVDACCQVWARVCERRRGVQAGQQRVERSTKKRAQREEKEQRAAAERAAKKAAHDKERAAKDRAAEEQRQVVMQGLDDVDVLANERRRLQTLQVRADAQCCCFCEHGAQANVRMYGTQRSRLSVAFGSRHASAVVPITSLFSSACAVQEQLSKNGGPGPVNGASVRNGVAASPGKGAAAGAPAHGSGAVGGSSKNGSSAVGQASASHPPSQVRPHCSASCPRSCCDGGSAVKHGCSHQPTFARARWNLCAHCRRA